MTGALGEGKGEVLKGRAHRKSQNHQPVQDKNSTREGEWPQNLTGLGKKITRNQFQAKGGGEVNTSQPITRGTGKYEHPVYERVSGNLHLGQPKEKVAPQNRTVAKPGEGGKTVWKKGLFRQRSDGHQGVPRWGGLGGGFFGKMRSSERGLW